MKELSEISLQYPNEQAYHDDPTISYSNLSHYERGGFEALATLRDRKESPALLHGSMLDCWLTDGPEEYYSRYFVADFPNVPDSILPIVNALFAEFGETHDSLTDIPNSEVIGYASQFNYQNNWKPETRAKVIKEKAYEYYKLMHLAGDKQVVSSELHNKVIEEAELLRTSENTKYFFQEDNPFDGIKRYYQLIFKATLNGITYKCMFDLLVVDYENKTIQPVDLKTSGKKEFDFYKSFAQWRYDIQNRLYVRILHDNLNRDDYFKDFIILPYKDIVINKDSLKPLVWDYPDTFKIGTLYYGKNNQYEFRDPEEIGKELDYYLTTGASMPIGIDNINSNNIVNWLNTI